MKKKGKIFYGWYVVAAESLMAAMIIGIIYNCYGLFVVPVCGELGFPRQAMAMTQTILSLCGLGVSLLAGKLLNRRYGLRLVRLGAVVTPLAYGCYSFVSQEWMLFPIALVVGVGYMLASCLSAPVIVSNWFDEKRGLALGMAMMGSGLGGMLFNVVTGQLLALCGWRITYRILAALIFAVCVPCAFFVVRFCPEDMGLRPYGYKAAVGNGENGEGPLFSQVWRTPRFWGLCLLLLLTSFCTSQLSQTTSPRLQDAGYSVGITSGIISLSMAALALGKVVVGRWFDRLGVGLTTVVGSVAVVLYAVGLLFCGNNLLLPLVVLGFGIGCAYGSVASPNMTRSLYGRRDYAAIYGVVNALASAGGIFGPLVSAAVFDSTGSYALAYGLVLVCIAVVSLLGVWVLRPKKAENG